MYDREYTLYFNLFKWGQLYFSFIFKWGQLIFHSLLVVTKKEQKKNNNNNKQTNKNKKQNMDHEDIVCA